MHPAGHSEMKDNVGKAPTQRWSSGDLHKVVAAAVSAWGEGGEAGQ